jgi:hypothetical protein
MDAIQALNYLMQNVVLKDGLTIPEAAAVVQAWNVLAEALNKQKDTPVEK